MPSQMPAILQAVMKGQSKALADAHYPCWHLALRCTGNSGHNHLFFF